MSKGIFTWYREIRGKSPSGQIAGLLTIIIAIIFLFIAITINIGKVSSVKTTATVATDGAALTLASSLASQGHALSERYLEGKTRKCDINWLAILTLGLSILASIFFPGAWYYYIAGGALGTMTEIVLVTPHQLHSFNRQMAEMTAETAVEQSTIQYAFLATIDDPEMVVDYNDYDEDGRTDDKISRFSAWHQHRLCWLAKDTDALKEAIKKLKQYVEEWYSDCKVIRHYISGSYDWPQPPIGVFIDLLQDIDGKIDEPEYEKGIVYDFVIGWDKYGGSGDVFDLKLKERQEKTRHDNIWYDFTFWTDGMNPDNENDPVNDGVDFFLSDLQTFRRWCWGDWEPVANPDGEKGFLQFSVDELTRDIAVWYSDLKAWTEDNFYAWQEERGPLENWSEELLNSNLLKKINEAIEKLENQIENHQGLYHGGLKTILNGKDDLKDDEKEHLNKLINALEDSIVLLEDIGLDEFIFEYFVWKYKKNIHWAADTIEEWRERYNEFHVKWEAFKEVHEAIKAPDFAEYTWKDSLGEHKVRVEVKINPYYPQGDGTKIPYIHAYKKYWGFQKCYDLKNYNGNVVVTVERTDTRVKDINLAQRLLWRFRSPKVKNSASAYYNIYPDSIRIIT